MEGEMMGAPDLLALGEEYRRLRSRLPLGGIKGASEYSAAVVLLDEILDLIGEDEAHPLADLAEAIGTFIEAYDHQHYAAALSSSSGSPPLSPGCLWPCQQRPDQRKYHQRRHHMFQRM